MSLLGSFQPEKQKVDSAINVVCDRLEHATLLQDRRAAVLSLKGFAREYKEAVTAGGLRGLLKSLTIDQKDEETLKATLECLLTLFTIDDKGSVDDTTLWIADEFTLRPENSHVLLDIVVEQNYYIRLNAMQILGCILECRPTQLQDCIMSSPTGIGAIVGVLDDQREQVRNEGLLLLSGMVKNHTEIEKRVAFENAFEKVFAIITEEGGLQGGIVTADCFSLLHNLLSDNISNQNWFRETEFFKKLTDLLQEVDKEKPFSMLVIKNVSSLLELVRLFVPADSTGKTTNQNALMKSGIVTQVVGFAYHARVHQDVRAQSWLTLADLIHNNKALQDYFAKASAIAVDPMNVAKSTPEDISPLLSLLLNGDEDSFWMKHAVSRCVQSFAYGNQQRKLKILQNMIDSYLASAEGNLLDCMLAVGAQDDQSRVWFATCTLLHLTHEDHDAQQMLTDFTVGDASAGEEEVSIIQIVSGNLITSIQRDRPRSTAAYLMLLTSWLFESSENVADFLEEQSTLQELLGVLQADSSDVIKGLSATLLATCYAFNFSENTSMNRRSLQTTLLRVGREAIVGSIVRFSHLEALRQHPTNTYDKPLLDETFIDFFRDNYGKFRKSIDQLPIPPRTRKEEEEQEEQARNDDMLVELETELERKTNSMNEAVNIIKTRQEEVQRLRDEVAYMNRKHESEASQAKKDIETHLEQIQALKAEAERASRDLDKSQRENAVLSRDYDAVRKVGGDHAKSLETSNAKIEDLEARLESEASKRSFLEKELSSLKDTSRLTDERLQATLLEFDSLKQQHEGLEAEAKSNRVILSDMKEELSTSKSAQKKSESDAVSAKTKAHDLETEMKGLQQQVEAGQQDLAKQTTKFEEEKKELEAKASSSSEHEQVLVALKAKETEYIANIESLKSTHAEELSRSKDIAAEELSRSKETAAKTLAAEQQLVVELHEELEQVKKLSEKAMPISSTKVNGASKAEKSLQEEVSKLKEEKEELQKQLEQAQEDLMLLMEDEAGEDEASSGDVD